MGAGITPHSLLDLLNLQVPSTRRKHLLRALAHLLLCLDQGGVVDLDDSLRGHRGTQRPENENDDKDIPLEKINLRSLN